MQTCETHLKECDTNRCGQVRIYICEEKKKMTRALIPQLVISLLTIPLVTPSLYGPKDQVLQDFMAQIKKVQIEGVSLPVGMVFALTLPLLRW